MATLRAVNAVTSIGDMVEEVRQEMDVQRAEREVRAAPPSAEAA